MIVLQIGKHPLTAEAPSVLRLQNLCLQSA